MDIYETPEELVLVADMPGVSRDNVEVHLDGDTLTVEGRPSADEYEGLKPLHVEYGVGGFYRRFTLGETIDRTGIKGRREERRPDAAPAEGGKRPGAAHRTASGLTLPGARAVLARLRRAARFRCPRDPVARPRQSRGRLPGRPKVWGEWNLVAAACNLRRPFALGVAPA